MIIYGPPFLHISYCYILVVEGLASSTDSSKIVGEGCLSPVLELLAQCKDKTGENWQVLLYAISIKESIKG